MPRQIQHPVHKNRTNGALQKSGPRRIHLSAHSWTTGTELTGDLIGGPHMEQLIGQLLLPIFMLMILVGVVGGNPSMVLKPTFDILGQIVMAVISLLSTLITTLFRVGLSGLLSGAQALLSGLQSGSSRQIK